MVPSYVIIRRMSKKVTPTTIKGVLFDLGKVLFHFDFDPAFRRLARHCALSAKDIEAYFIQSGLEVLYDGGKISSQQFYLQVKKALGLKMSFKHFKSTWNHIFTPISPMIRLVGQLKRKSYRLVLISNTNSMHFEYLKKFGTVLKNFDHLVLSYKEKRRKPDERLYRVAIRACRAKPHEIFYIDDRADLTEAAEALGLNTFTFKNNPAELRRVMREIGIL